MTTLEDYGPLDLTPFYVNPATGKTNISDEATRLYNLAFATMKPVDFMTAAEAARGEGFLELADCLQAQSERV